MVSLVVPAISPQWCALYQSVHSARRFCHVGLTNDGEFGQFIADVTGLIFRLYQCRYRIQYFAGAAAADGRNKKICSKPDVANSLVFQQAPWIYPLYSPTRKTGLLLPAQHISHAFIQVGNAGAHIHHKDDGIGFFHRDHHLFADFLFKTHHHSRQQNHRYQLHWMFSGPLCHTILAVACYTTHIIHDGFTLLEHAVEEGALPTLGRPVIANVKLIPVVNWYFYNW